MIQWTPEQKEVMDFLIAQVDNPEGSNVVVSGSGGTGKTTIICELICQLLATGHKVAVTAMTGKATAVLRNKVNQAVREKQLRFPKENLLIETVTKITKKSKVMDVSTNGETKYSSTWRNPNVFPYDVLFVDELSMVPHYISRWWQMTDCRVFGFGDECQLPEVVTQEIKGDLAGFEHDLHLPPFKYVSGYGIKALKSLAQCQLHKVLRSDNECALLCHDLRDFSKTKGEIVQIIKKYADQYDHINYSTTLKDLKTDPDWQILCYTNKMCQQINNELCIGGDRYPNLRDKILLFDNLNPLRMYNGDTLLFQDFLERIARFNARAIERGGRQVAVCMKWRGRMPTATGNEFEQMFYSQMCDYYQKKKIIDQQRVVQIPAILETSGFAPKLIDEYQGFFESLKGNGRTDEAVITDFMDYLSNTDVDMYQFVADGLLPSPMLYFVKADYGYAITTHKSQGSEYPKVCYLLEKFDKPLLYTGLSRAKEELEIINLTSTR